MTLPKIPSTIKIGHATYTVEMNRDALEASDSEGLSTGNELKIILRDDRPHAILAETLLHEVMHQCLYMAGLDCTRLGEDGMVGRDAEEVMIRAMAGTLRGVFLDNPGLLPWLLHET